MKLIHKENGWVGTKDKKYAVHVTKNGLTLAVNRVVSKEYDTVTIYDLDILKEAVKLYEDALSIEEVKDA